MSTYNDKTVESWQQQMQALMEELDERKPFSYDPEADALYQQYREQYQNAGRLAMEDTVGIASGLTGGYGSTYAENAGAAAYGQYLDKLNDVLPELYEMRRSDYNKQTDLLFDRLSFAGEQAQSAQSAAQKTADAAFERCIALLENGIQPSAEELAAAGLSAQSGAALGQFYGTVSGGSGGNSNSNSNSNSNTNSSSYAGNGNLTAAQVMELQEYLGVSVDGQYGPKTQAAAEAMFGTAGMSAAQAWIAYQKAIGAYGGGSSGGGTGGPNTDHPH